MMNKVYSMTIWSLSLSMLVMAGKLSAEEYKIGVVNAARVLEQSHQAKAAQSIIEKEFSLRDQQLITDQKSIKELGDRVQKDRAVMSNEEVARLERELLSKRRELKRDQDEFREDLNLRRNEELAKIQKELVEAIKKIAIDEQYDLILSEGVVYMSAKVDITQRVIDYLNQGRQAD